MQRPPVASTHPVWRGIVKTLSRLPLWLTYRLSDIGFLCLYYLVGYRKKVVRQNLRNSFPDASPASLGQIERGFYRHFCDLVVEILRAFTMSDAELRRRYVIQNPELIDALIAEGASAILLSHHYGNFEWLSSRIDLLFNHRIPTYGLYTPLKNTVAEDLIHFMRSRRGIQMVPMTGSIKQVLRDLKTTACAYGFMTDQSPSRGQKLHFSAMFGQPTAIPTVVAKIVLKTGARLLYTDVRKVKRGHYSLRLIAVDAEPFLPGTADQVQAFTDAQVQLLEQNILQGPAYWLWSHRRWKHKPRAGDTFSPALSSTDHV